LAARRELTNENGCIVEDGHDAARSIYGEMTKGGRGFAEYFIWSNDEDKRIRANEKLDYLRVEIWKLFSE